MRFIYLGLTLLLSVLMHCQPLMANEAQASLTGRSSTYQYEIPESLNVDEKYWFKVFQEGNFLAIGWQEISAEIMVRTPPEKRQAQKIALDNLGKKIGMEWSRSNGVRKVSSSMLQEWGSILRKTAKKNPQHLAQTIVFIDQEVDDVLD